MDHHNMNNSDRAKLLGFNTPNKWEHKHTRLWGKSVMVFPAGLAYGSGYGYIKWIGLS